MGIGVLCPNTGPSWAWEKELTYTMTGCGRGYLRLRKQNSKTRVIPGLVPLFPRLDRGREFLVGDDTGLCSRNLLFTQGG